MAGDVNYSSLEQVLCWTTVFLITAALLCVSITTLHRQRLTPGNKRIQEFSSIRYLTFFCIILQCITFLGYYLRNPYIHESLWNVWVPLFTLGLGLLSQRITKVYVETTSIVLRDSCLPLPKPNYSAFRPFLLPPSLVPSALYSPRGKSRNKLFYTRARGHATAPSPLFLCIVHCTVHRAAKTNNNTQ